MIHPLPQLPHHVLLSPPTTPAGLPAQVGCHQSPEHIQESSDLLTSPQAAWFSVGYWNMLYRCFEAVSTSRTCVPLVRGPKGLGCYSENIAEVTQRVDTLIFYFQNQALFSLSSRDPNEHCHAENPCLGFSGTWMIV